MAELELYINKVEGAPHNFIRRDGSSCSALPFQSADNNVMLAKAREILEADDSYGGRVRIFDITNRYLKDRGGIRWVPLKDLQRWTAPGAVREPQPNEEILGKAA